MFTSEVDCLTAVITNIKQRDHIQSKTDAYTRIQMLFVP